MSTISKTTDNPFVRKFHYDEKSTKISGENWHSDQSCAAIPPLGSMLYNHTVPPDGGGDTMFASMYAAYDALSPRMQTYLEGLTATHDGTRVFGPGTPISVHPVIIRHPVSGKKVIYVNTDFTSHINEVPRKESERILAFLYRPLRARRMGLPVSLAAAFDRVLGQSVRAAQGALGLLAARALGISRPGRWDRRTRRRIGHCVGAIVCLARPPARCRSAYRHARRDRRRAG